MRTPPVRLLFATKRLIAVLLTWTAAIAAQTSDAAVVATVSSPTVVEAGSYNGPTQQFQSVDTSSFDHTAQSEGLGDFFATASAFATLRLDISSQGILSSLNAGAVAQGTGNSRGLASGFYIARFSLDIVVDSATTFSFVAQTSFLGVGRLEYWFHTPGSNELDVRFGHSADAMLDSGSVNGTLRPGALYRFEMENQGSASSQGIFRSVDLSHFEGSSSLVFAVPEPTSTTSLLGGAICLCLRRRSRRSFERSRLPERVEDRPLTARLLIGFYHFWVRQGRAFFCLA